MNKAEQTKITLLSSFLTSVFPSIQQKLVPQGTRNWPSKDTQYSREAYNRISHASKSSDQEWAASAWFASEYHIVLFAFKSLNGMPRPLYLFIP